jgi:lysyl-tRNA synthetase class 2
VIDARRGFVRVWGATAAVSVHLAGGEEALPLYALVEVVGRSRDGALHDATAEVVGGPLRDAPAADGDLFFLAAGDGRRARALALRSKALGAVRRWFDGEGFLEVDTPTMVPSPGLDPHLGAFAVEGRGYLTTSPEYQMKRLLSAGFARIYQLGRSYRDDELGPSHEPEFALLEWYRAFAGAEEVMADTESMVAEVARALLGTTRLPIRGGRVVDVAPPWERLSVEEAYRRYAGAALDDLDEAQFFRLMVETVQPSLGAERPVFLTRWPASMASLARLCPDDPRYAERFEAYVDGLELCNGFGELTDAVEQRARLERDQATRREAGLPVYPIDERFLAALEDGVPPSGGNALGVDRLVLLLAGASALEDVVFVPSRRL